MPGVRGTVALIGDSAGALAALGSGNVGPEMVGVGSLPDAETELPGVADGLSATSGGSVAVAGACVFCGVGVDAGTVVSVAAGAGVLVGGAGTGVGLSGGGTVAVGGLVGVETAVGVAVGATEVSFDRVGLAAGLVVAVAIAGTRVAVGCATVWVAVGWATVWVAAGCMTTGTCVAVGRGGTLVGDGGILGCTVRAAAGAVVWVAVARDTARVGTGVAVATLVSTIWCPVEGVLDGGTGVADEVGTATVLVALGTGVAVDVGGGLLGVGVAVSGPRSATCGEPPIGVAVVVAVAGRPAPLCGRTVAVGRRLPVGPCPWVPLVVGATGGVGRLALVMGVGFTFWATELCGVGEGRPGRGPGPIGWLGREGFDVSPPFTVTGVLCARGAGDGTIGVGEGTKGVGVCVGESCFRATLGGAVR